MNLTNKKELASKTLKVGKNRICFDSEHLNEIKEAITKQDIKELYEGGIISIKPVKGRKKIKRRKTRVGPGKIKRRINNRKQNYVKITRKLRAYLKNLQVLKKIDKDLYVELRKKIRMKVFKSKAHFKEYLENTAGVKLNNEEKQSSVKKKESKKNKK